MKIKLTLHYLPIICTIVCHRKSEFSTAFHIIQKYCDREESAESTNGLATVDTAWQFSVDDF